MDLTAHVRNPHHLLFYIDLQFYVHIQSEVSIFILKDFTLLDRDSNLLRVIVGPYFANLTLAQVEPTIGEQVS